MLSRGACREFLRRASAPTKADLVETIGEASKSVPPKTFSVGSGKLARVQRRREPLQAQYP